MQQHALSEGLLVAMEERAAKQPAALPDALEAVERISELLDLSGLFSALLRTLAETGSACPTRAASESADLTSDTLAPTALWSPTSRRTGAAR